MNIPYYPVMTIDEGPGMMVASTVVRLKHNGTRYKQYVHVYTSIEDGQDWDYMSNIVGDELLKEAYKRIISGKVAPQARDSLGLPEFIIDECQLSEKERMLDNS